MKRRQVLSQIGRFMKRCFSAGDELALDGLGVTRRSYRDEHYRERQQYRVYRMGETPGSVPF